MAEGNLPWRHFLKLFLPLAGLVIVAALVIGQARMSIELNRMGDDQLTRVRLGSAQFVAALKKPQQHLMSIRKEAPVRAALDDPSPDKMAGMAQAFTSLLDRNPEYDQARWIDEKGVERVRVDRSKDGAGVAVVTAPNLQNEANRYYFKDTVHLEIGKIFISQLDLNVENGKIEVPHKPMLRFVTAVADRAGIRRGILVINYLAGPLLEAFGRTLGRGGRHLMLLNGQGYWLADADHPADEWGFMFGVPATLGSRYPAVWARIKQAPSGQFLGPERLWTWQTVTPPALGPARPDAASAPTWIAVSHPSAAAVRSVYLDVWLPTVLVGTVAVMFLAALSWLIAVRAKQQGDALRAEAAVRESRRRVAELEQAQKVSARLTAIIESTEDAIVGKDLDGTITTWNPGAEKLFGYRADEAIGRSIQMLLAPGQEAEERRILERIAGGDTIGHFETRRVHKDGRLIDVSVTISPVRDAAGGVIGASKIARDITDAKRAEAELTRHREHLEELVEERTAQIAATTERLREREKFITTVTDNLPGMVGYWDRELRCRFANRAYLDWFGRDSAQILGITIEALLGDALFQLNRPAIEAVLKGEPQQFEVEIRKLSGELGYGLANYIPDRKDDAVIGFFVLATDVTPLKEAQGELRQTNDKLAQAVAVAEAASAAKSRFLANMSHEIRTPMNGVIGMLEILGHTKLDSDQARIVGTINGSARSLLQIINDILDFSKIEAGQLKIELIAADPTEIVESTTRLFLGAAAAKGLALRCFVTPGVRGQYLTDPMRLRQILSNLLSNAIKFTSVGGVSITAEVVPGDDGTESLRFVVADTGVGISREAQARLFQPFSQADDTTAREFGGTGLGLSICLRLANLMDGGIELASVEDDGTQVTLVVPARPVETGAEDAALDLHGVRVALITPDEAERRHFTAYLTHWGADVTVMSPRPRAAAPPPEPFTLILAPLASMAEIGVDAAMQDAIPVGPPRRVVFYSYDDEPADRKPTNDTIVTTALSRARIITAVAVAAGRKSPEIEIVRPLPQLASRRAAPSREQAIREGRLILLAEDHPVNREVTLRQLRLLGYAADAVEDGLAALEALSETRYGLLLTDCNMPKMDGFALTRRIRLAETGSGHLPIIALTANALDGEDRKCLAAGMDDYLAKPVEMATLCDRLERWLSAAAPGSVQTTAAPAAPQAVSGADVEPALNLTVLAEYCGDDPVAIRDNLKLFVDTMRADFECLSAAVAQNNAVQTQLLAHRMKGAARIVGGHALATCSEAVELAAGAGDWAAIERDMPLLLAATVQIDQMYDTIC